MSGRRTHRKVIGGLAVAAVSMALSVAGAARPQPAQATWDAETASFLTLLNAYRAQQNPPAPAVQLETTLQQAADWQDNDQLVTANCTAPGASPCSHTDSTGRSLTSRVTGAPPGGFGYGGIPAENMCWSTPSAQTVLDCWKNSPVHNSNMLDPAFLAVGIARQCNAAGNCLWVTVYGDKLITPFTPPATSAVPVVPASAAKGWMGTGQADAAVRPTLRQAAAPSWTGTWETDFGTLTLAQTGDQVTGTYAYVSASSVGAVNGTLMGTVTGNALTGTWSAVPAAPPFDSGTFRFALGGDNQSFMGDIIYANGEGDIWNGKRAD